MVFDGCEVDPEIEKLAEARTAAKKAKDFAEADRIRAMTDEGTQQKWAELQEKTDTMLQSYEALRLALQK